MHFIFFKLKTFKNQKNDSQLEPKPYVDLSRGPGGIIFKGSLHEEEKHKLDKEMPECWRGRVSNKSVS